MQTAIFSAFICSWIKWSGLLKLSHIEILDQIITYHRNYPMHYKMLSSILSFAHYMLAASFQLFPDIATCPLEGKNILGLGPLINIFWLTNCIWVWKSQKRSSIFGRRGIIHLYYSTITCLLLPGSFICYHIDLHLMIDRQLFADEELKHRV